MGEKSYINKLTHSIMYKNFIKEKKSMTKYRCILKFSNSIKNLMKLSIYIHQLITKCNHEKVT